jgi:carotenoid cleavage dioxygenase-like enzyme
MPTLTRNPFYGSGEGHFALDVEGDWPADLDGYVFNVGPDREMPGGHWFAGQGLLMRIGCSPDASGRIGVDLRRIQTPIESIRRELPHLFRRRGVQETSSFGFTSFANTNVQSLGERLFIGYDVGRPIEVDPESLETLTPVGRNAEWLQAFAANPGASVGIARALSGRAD